MKKDNITLWDSPSLSVKISKIYGAVWSMSWEFESDISRATREQLERTIGPLATYYIHRHQISPWFFGRFGYIQCFKKNIASIFPMVMAGLDKTPARHKNSNGEQIPDRKGSLFPNMPVRHRGSKKVKSCMERT